jgi:hypothetical protein
MSDTFETKPDVLHRYGTLVLGGLGFVVGLIHLAVGSETKLTLFTFGASALIGLFGWWRLSDRLVVSPAGLCIGRTRLDWQQVASYRYRDVSHPWEPTQLADLLLWPFVVLGRWLIYWPVRTIVRWLWFRARDRKFVEAELVLLDATGKTLATLEGKACYLDVAEALDRIIATLHARPLPPFTVDGLQLDAVNEIEVQRDTTIVRTASGKTSRPTEEIPNLYLVLEAIAARGGRVRVDSDIFIPSPLANALAA